jgi:hypothetical protein
MVLLLCLVACDRGGAPAKQQERPRDAAPSDTSPLDAAPADAEVVELIDAMPLAPPKPAAAQKRDCTTLSKVLGSKSHSREEERDFNAAVKKLCVETPWSATVVDCVLREAKADDNNTWSCLDMLPADQKQTFDKKSHDIFCEYNDCIPPGFHPDSPAPTGGPVDEELEKLLNGN